MSWLKIYKFYIDKNRKYLAYLNWTSIQYIDLLCLYQFYNFKLNSEKREVAWRWNEGCAFMNKINITKIAQWNQWHDCHTSI